MNIKYLAEVLRQIQSAQQAGKQLKDPSVWADRATLTTQLVILLNLFILMIGPICRTVFHTPPPIDLEEIPALAEILSVVGVFAANKLHTASNLDAGKAK